MGGSWKIYPLVACIAPGVSLEFIRANAVATSGDDAVVEFTRGM